MRMRILGAGWILLGMVPAATRAQAGPHGGPHEPPGFTLITDRPFDAKVEDGWTDRGDPWFSIVQDPSAPKSPPGVGQAMFPRGYEGGSGPILTAHRLGPGYRDLYLAMWIRFSSNWVGHRSGVNKILHIWIDGRNKLILMARGIGRGPLLATVGLQGLNEAQKARVGPLCLRCCV